MTPILKSGTQNKHPTLNDLSVLHQVLNVSSLQSAPTNKLFIKKFVYVSYMGVAKDYTEYSS
jgi:hypothetical protein